MKYINADDYKNQKEIILAHIKEYGNISTLEGYNRYKIMRVRECYKYATKRGVQHWNNNGVQQR